VNSPSAAFFHDSCGEVRKIACLHADVAQAHRTIKPLWLAITLLHIALPVGNAKGTSKFTGC
jgi:hypothetical protein